MKRSYDETDRAIPAKLWEYFPQKKQQLLQIKSMENTLQTLLCQYKRKKLFSNCSERILNKILRIYIRHQYIPPGNSSSSSNTTSGEGGTPITVPITTKGYYLLTIEGKLLDLLTNDHYPFGLFFDQIRIHVDKKYLPSDGDITLYEWKKDQYQAGKKANCFQFKIYCDKSIPIKIYLTRSDYSCKRYELAISLRDLLPNMRIDPTEDEVMTAVWQYIELHSSYDFSTNRPLLRCDEKLRAVLGGDTIPLSNVKSKIMESLHPCRPIIVDYTLLLDETPPLETTDLSSKSIIKAGGRVFDISVDIIDPVSSAIVSDLNQLTSLEMKIEPVLSEIERRSDYIVTSLRHCHNEIEELQRVATCPIPPDLLTENNILSFSNIGCLPKRTFLHPIIGIDKPHNPSSYENLQITGTEFFLSLNDTSRLVGGRDMTREHMIQNLRYSFNGLRTHNVFADVANDYLFLPSLPWMKRHKEIGDNC